MGEFLGRFGWNSWRSSDRMKLRVRHHKFHSCRMVWGGWRNFRFNLVIKNV